MCAWDPTVSSQLCRLTVHCSVRQSGCKLRAPRCSEISERVLTSGDVGTPVSELRNEFSPLEGCFGGVKEGEWWHDGKKNCPGRGVFGEKETGAAFKVCTSLSQLRCSLARPTACEPTESKAANFGNGVQERIAAAKRWLERQPEAVIFLYGHSVFWKAFFAHSEALRNCEYRLVHW